MGITSSHRLYRFLGLPIAFFVMSLVIFSNLRVQAADSRIAQDKALAEASFTFAAYLLALYPDGEFYFLGEESLPLLTAAMLAASGQEEAERMHMISPDLLKIEGDYHLYRNRLTRAYLEDDRPHVLITPGPDLSLIIDIKNRLGLSRGHPNLTSHTLMSLDSQVSISHGFIYAATGKDSLTLKTFKENFERLKSIDLVNYWTPGDWNVDISVAEKFDNLRQQMTELVTTFNEMGRRALQSKELFSAFEPGLANALKKDLFIHSTIRQRQLQSRAPALNCQDLFQ